MHWTITFRTTFVLATFLPGIGLIKPCWIGGKNLTKTHPEVRWLKATLADCALDKGLFIPYVQFKCNTPCWPEGGGFAAAGRWGGKGGRRQRCRRGWAPLCSFTQLVKVRPWRTSHTTQWGFFIDTHRFSRAGLWRGPLGKKPISLWCLTGHRINPEYKNKLYPSSGFLLLFK